MLLGAGAVNAQSADDAAEAAKAAALTRKIDALGVVWKDVESHPLGSDDRKKYLREFLDKSELVWTIPPDHRSLDGLWTMRALAAYELDLKREAWEAGDAMVRLGLDRSDNDLIRKTLAQLERKGLLDPEAPDVKRFVQERQQLKEARGHANPVDALKAQAILDKLLQAAPDHRPALALREQIKPWVQELNKPRIAELLATAQANDNKTSGKAALAALEELLKLDPNHGEAKKLREKISSYFGPPVTLDLGGGVKLATVKILSGKFTMGSPASETGREDDETQKSVTIDKDFYMGESEVTQAQWKAVMGTTPWKGKTIFVKEGDAYPATFVSWNDAQAFMEKVSKLTGKKVRLPSEAEWEYACRGGTTTAYSFGDSDRNLSDYAWYDKNAYAIGEKYAHEVKTKKPNPWGLYDMHGNVWEWCEDSYGVVYRVLRGGCWIFNPEDCRSALRYRGTPDIRDYFNGFRVVLDF